MSTIIKYSGNDLIDLEYEHFATLFCNERKMAADLEVLFDGNGYVQYGDTKISAEEGQCVILQCAGKLMKNDVVVYVETTYDTNFIFRDKSALITSDDKIFNAKEN